MTFDEELDNLESKGIIEKKVDPTGEIFYRYRLSEDIMSKWQHNICIECWSKRQPGREPTHIKDSEETKCCFCGERNRDGIYVRTLGTDLLCKGLC